MPSRQIPLPARAANLKAAYAAYGGLISHTVADPSPATIVDEGNAGWTSGAGLPDYRAWFRTGFTTLPPLANSFGGVPFDEGPGSFAAIPCATFGTTGGSFGNGTNSLCWRVAIQTDAATVGWDMLTGSGFRFIVNGKYQSLTPMSVGTGGPTQVNVFMSGSALRTVMLEGTQDDQFDGVALLSTDFIQRFAWNPLARMIVVGDSFTAATGATNVGDGYATLLGDNIGAMDTWASGLGGTGYVATSGGTAFNLTQRLGDVNNNGPWDAIIVAMGLNDIGTSSATIQANANTCFTSYRANNPETPIFVVGPWDGNAPSAPVANYVACKNAIQAAMVGITYCYFIDMQGVAYSQAAGLLPHPDTAGHATLAAYILNAMKAVLGIT